MSLLGFLIEYKWVLLFYLIVGIIVFANRKRFDIEARFFYLLRTKFGLKLIDRLAKHERIVRTLGLIGTFIGFIGIFFITGMMGLRVYKVVVNQEASGIAPVLPGLPIAGTGIDFPLVIGWIALFIIILIHEFAHGVVARAHKIPVKSSGIAFFGPILAAFVEPDEKRLVKARLGIQNAVFSAGPFANFVTSILFLLILAFVLTPLANSLTLQAGVKIEAINDTPAFRAGIPPITVVGLNNYSVGSLGDFYNASTRLLPNQSVELLASNGSRYKLITTAREDNASRGYMGVLIKGVVENPKYPNVLGRIAFGVMRWLSRLFFWLYFISLNLGLINLFPIFITDGARIIQSTFLAFIRDKKKALSSWKLVNQLCVLMLLTLLLLPIIRSIYALF